MIEIVGFFFISIVGALSHFLYDIGNHNKYFSIFFAVNESTWEHIKIALTPMFLWLIIEVPFLYQNTNFIFAKFIGLMCPLILIPTIFYGYKLITKKSILIIDISLFFVSVLFAQLLSSYILFKIPNVPFTVNYVSLIGIIVIFVFYMILTIYPFEHFLFKDPISKKYGIKAHTELKKK